MLKKRILAMTLAACMLFESFGVSANAAELSNNATVSVEEESVLQEGAQTEITAEEQTEERTLEEEVLEAETIEESETLIEREEVLGLDLPVQSEEVEKVFVESETTEIQEVVPLETATVSDEYVLDTEHEWNVSDVVIDPQSYKVRVNFNSDREIYTEEDVILMYTTDATLAEDFFKGESSVTDSESYELGFKTCNLQNISCIYEYSNYQYQVSGEFSGPDWGREGFYPNTTYYYRLAYTDGYSGDYVYYFKTEPMQFTTEKAIETTGISVTNLSVEESGYNYSKVIWETENPNDEGIIDAYFIYKGESDTEYNEDSKFVYATEHWEDEYGRIPGKYYASVYTNGKPLTGRVLYKIYTGEKELTSIYSEEIRLIPTAMSNAEVKTETTVGTGSFTATVQVSPWYDTDSFKFYVYYRKVGSSVWSNQSVTMREASDSVTVSNLEAGTEYEYYLSLSGLWKQGSADVPLTFTTKENIVYADELFEDQVFLAYLKETVEISESEQLSKAKLDGIKSIDCSLDEIREEIKSIEGIQYLTNLKTAYFAGQSIQDASPILGLANLESVDFDYNDIEKLPDLSGMNKLESAGFDCNLISDSDITAEKMSTAMKEYYASDSWYSRDWVEDTKSSQREKKVTGKLADTYYAIGATYPFFVGTRGLKNDARDYTIQISINGQTKDYTVESNYNYMSNSRALCIQQFDMITALGKYTISVKITDEYGHEWLKIEEQKVCFVEDLNISEDCYIGVNEKNISYSVTLGGEFSKEDIYSIDLLNESAEVVGSADYYRIYSAVRDDRYSESWDTDYGSVEILRDSTNVYAEISSDAYLSLGEYSVKINILNQDYVFENVIHVVDKPLIKSCYMPTENDNTGDYIYICVTGNNIDTSKVYPVFYKENKKITEFLSATEIRTGYWLYTLKKIDKDVYWNMSGYYEFEFESESGYDYIDAVDSHKVHLDFSPKVLIQRYNTKKQVYEVQFTSNVTDGIEVNCYIYPGYPMGTNLIAEGTAKVINGVAEFKFQDVNKKTYIPADGSELLFCFEYVDENGIYKEIIEDATRVIWYTPSGNEGLVVAASGITLDSKALTLQVNETHQLTATVKPANATNKNVTWVSSDTAVATVNSSGQITAAGAGTAKITAKTNNGKTATCTVTVYSYSISEKELFFDMSESTDAKTLVVSNGIKNLTATWSSENESVVSVDSKGNVTPKGIGETTITAVIKNGPTFTCDVKVVKGKLEAITLNETSHIMNIGEATKLRVFFKPVDATVEKAITWTSSEKNVAEVDTEGNVTALTAGTAVVTATVGNLKADCTITVQKVLNEEELETPTVSAITNVHKTLEEVKLPTGWRWENPAITLKQFAGVQVKSFAAIYEEEGAAPVYKAIPATLATLSKLTISSEQTTMLKDDTMQAELVWTVVGEEPDLSIYEENAVWTSNKATVATVDEHGLITAVGKGTAKIQVSVSVEDIVFKASYNVKVTEGEIAEVIVEEVENASAEENVYIVDLEKQNGNIKISLKDATKITVKNSNTAIVTLGKIKTENGVITIPYTLKAAGTTKITFTANDVLKTTKEIWLKVKDAAPSIDTASLTINRLMTVGSKFHIYPAQDYEVINPVLGGADKDLFTLESVGIEYTLKAKDDTVKGNYKVEVTVTSDNKDYTYPLKVKVAETKAKVTAKQAAKVNLFYTKNEAAAILNFTTTETITNVELKDCSYVLENRDSVYYVMPVDDTVTTKSDKAGILSVSLEDYKEPLEIKYNVSVESKAPKLALTSKSSVFYPVFAIESGKTSVTINGADYHLTGKTITLTDKKGNELNGYVLNVADDLIVIERTDVGAKAVSAMIHIKEDTWRNSVSLAYSIKINQKKPSLKLEKSTLQLNTNVEAFDYDMAVTAVQWKDATEFEPSRISVAAADKKSQAVLGSGIVIEVNGHEITARMNNTAVAKGTYKYKVYAKVNDSYTASTTLSVKVVDATLKKSVTLSTKGTIDVLNREGTSVVITQKLKSVNGTITAVTLKGRSAHLFNSEFVDGKVIITAKADAKLITKYNYGIQLELTLENEAGESTIVLMDETKLKLKQSSVKISVLPANAVFYSSVYNTVPVNVTATIKGADNPEITDIELLNYQNAFEYDYEEETLTLKDSGEVAKGKSYTLQFKVTLAGQADNEKNLILKYKVTLK